MDSPMVLAYAVDIKISENTLELERFLLEFIPMAVGLELNTSNSQVLIRDPIEPLSQPQKDSNMRLGNVYIVVVDKMKYLGIYSTNNINRPATVRDRIKSAYKIYYAIIPFFQKHELPFTLIRTMYNASHERT